MEFSLGRVFRFRGKFKILRFIQLGFTKFFVNFVLGLWEYPVIIGTLTVVIVDGCMIETILCAMCERRGFLGGFSFEIVGV